MDYYAYGVCAVSFEDQKAVFVSGVDCAPTVFRCYPVFADAKDFFYEGFGIGVILFPGHGLSVF